MRIPQIQGLRALAAVLVVVFHARFVPGGFIGVDIFYVISGYLITGLILKELDSTGRLDLKDFYQRRIKRLLPSSVVVLFVTAVAGFFILPATTRPTFGRDLFAAATYISNYLFAWWQNDYQNLDVIPSPYIHYWSLSVEEQFYLLWPLLILILFRFGRKKVLGGILALTVISLLFSVYLTNSSPIWGFYSLPSRAWELGIGALILFLPVRFRELSYLPWVGIAGLIFGVATFNETTAFPGYKALVPVLSIAVLIASINAWPKVLSSFANNVFSQWLGRISYPLYLWHWPLLILPISAFGRPMRIRERVFFIILTVVLAHLTSKFIEEPIRLRNFDRKKVFAFFGATTIASLCAGLLISTAGASTINAGSNLKFDLVKVVQTPRVYADGCHVNYGETVSGSCTYGSASAKETIILFGDSHAAQWFPALEKIALKNNFKLVSLTKSSCPATEVKRSNKGAFRNIDCDTWRRNSIDRINRIRPLAVVTSSFEYYELPPGVSDRNSWWSAGQKKLLSQLQGSSTHLFYIGDTPRPSRDIPTCLETRGVTGCDSIKKTPLSVIEGFEAIDPNPWLCTQTCPAVVGRFVAYRDASHISVDVALELTPLLEDELRNKGLFS